MAYRSRRPRPPVNSSCSSPLASCVAAQSITPVAKHATNLDRAIDAVKNRGISLRKAEVQYRVPRSTLQDHLSGRVAPGAQSGYPKYLTDDDEEMLVSFAARNASIGYLKDRQQVIDSKLHSMHFALNVNTLYLVDN